MSTWLILNAIGHDATLKLQRALGGGYVALRLSPKDDDPVVLALGRELAEKLAEKILSAPEGAAGKVYVGQHLVRRERNASILAARRAGHGIARIAHAHGLTQEAVRWVLRQFPDEPQEPRARAAEEGA